MKNIRDKIPLYVFDTALRAREERKKAALRHGGLLWGASYVTSEELLNRLYAVASGGSHSQPPVLRRVGRYGLLSQVVREAKERGELSFFASQAGMPGFLRHLLSFVQELKQAKIPAATFLECVSSPSFIKSFDSKNARDKFSELSQIYTRYEERKSQLGVIDEYDKEDAVTRYLIGANVGAKPFFLDAFSHACLVDLMDVSVLRFEFLKALLLHFKDSGRETSVVFPYDPEKQLIFRFLEKNLQRIESTGEEDVVTEHFWSMETRKKNDSIRFFLEKFSTGEKFYAYDAHSSGDMHPGGRKISKTPKKKTANVHVFCVEGTYRELEEVARRVRKLLDEGVMPSGIGILFRDLTPYEKLIHDIFSRFSIPLSFRRANPVLFSPVVKALLLLLRLPKDNFRQSDLLSFLRSAYFSFTECAQEIENAICRCGIFSGTRDEWKRAMLSLSRQALLQAEALDNGDDASPRSAEKAKKKEQLQNDARRLQELSVHLFSLLSVFEPFFKNKTFSFFLQAYEKLMEKFDVERNASLVSDPVLLKRSQESLSAFHDALGELRRLLEHADLKMDAQWFYDMVVEAMREEVTASPSVDGGVCILNIGDAVGFCFSHVFLPALTENVFPKKQYENPLLKSAERVPLRRLLDRPSSFRTLSEKYLEDPLLFYLALHCAEKDVFLSYSTMDFQGRQTVRSRFVEEVLETFQYDGCPYKFDKDLTPLDENGELIPVPFVSVLDASPPRSFLTQDEFFAHLVTSVFRKRDTKEEMPSSFYSVIQNKNHLLHKPLMRIFSLIVTEKQRELFYGEENRIKRAGNGVANSFTGRLMDEKVRMFVVEHFAKKTMLSASFLENYGTCPFQFFCKEVLRLAEPQVAELEVSPLVEGSFVHEVLALFFKTFPQLLRDENEEKALMSIFEERWEVWKQKHYLGNVSLQNAKHSALKKALRRFYAHEYERAQGWQWDESLIERQMKKELSAGGAKINFYGRADKIEYKKDGDVFHLRVVDFKNSKSAVTGANGEKAKSAASGVLGFQLPLYSLLILEEFQCEKKSLVSSVTAEYRAVRADKKGSFVAAAGGKRNPLNFAETARKEHFLKCAGNTLSSIENGQFDVTPYSYDISCAFCAFKTICRYEDVLESYPMEENE